MKMLYFVFVNPYFNYGNIVWGSIPKYKLSKLYTLQKRAVRIVFRAPRGSHSEPLMVDNNILNIYQINLISYFKFMNKVKNSNVPLCIKSNFDENKHKYSTRYSEATFKTKSYQVKKENKFSYMYRGPRIWNYLVCLNPGLVTCKNPKIACKRFIISGLKSDFW